MLVFVFVSVYPLRVPTLKMAVLLFLPCAGGPNSGRKSDAQRLFPRIQDAQSHASKSTCTIPNPVFEKNKKYVQALHCIAPHHET